MKRRLHIILLKKKKIFINIGDTIRQHHIITKNFFNYTLLLISPFNCRVLKMTVNTSVGVLLLLLVSCVFSQPRGCWRYGDCDPGPDCKNWDNGLDNDQCWSCCDGKGFVTKDKLKDGNTDCINGSDEKDWDEILSQRFISLGDNVQCLRPKQNCTADLECCSRNCLDGNCWDDFCG